MSDPCTLIRYYELVSCKEQTFAEMATQCCTIRIFAVDLGTSL